MKKKHFLFILSIIVIIVALLGYKTYKKVNTSDVSKQVEQQNNENAEDAKGLSKKQGEEKVAMKGVKPVKSEVAQDTVKKLIDSVYFKKGTYEDYKALFLLPDRVASKEKFEEARNKVNLVDKFGKQYKNSDEIVKQCTIETKDNMTNVIFKSGDGNKENRWQIVQKDGKCFIYNALPQ